MNNSPKIIKLSVTKGARQHFINAHYDNGTALGMGTQKTERGIRTCMTRIAKRAGLTVRKTESAFELTAE